MASRLPGPASANAPRTLNVSKLPGTRRQLPAPKNSASASIIGTPSGVPRSLSTVKRAEGTVTRTSSNLTRQKTGIKVPGSAVKPTPTPSQINNNSNPNQPTQIQNFKIGDEVELLSNAGRYGIVKFSGETKFAPGPWIGVELETEEGKNDGSVKGVSYFEAKPNYGVFCRPTGIKFRHPQPVQAASVEKVTPPEISERRSSAVSSTNTTPTATAGSTTGGRKVLRAPGGTPMKKEKSTLSSTHPNTVSANSLSPTPRSSLSPSQLSKFPFKINDRVVVSGTKVGIIQFLGKTEFAEGIWVGVELDQALGKNDGSVKGVRYFTCRPNYGVMAPMSKIVKAGAGGPPPGTMRRENSALSVSSFGSLASTTSNVAEARKRAAAESRAKILMAKQRAAAVTASNTRKNPGQGPGSTAGQSAISMNKTLSSLPDHIKKASPLVALQSEIKEKEQQISKLLQQIDEYQEENAALRTKNTVMETLVESKQAELDKAIEEPKIKTTSHERSERDASEREESERNEELQFAIEETKIEYEDKIKELESKLQNEVSKFNLEIKEKDEGLHAMKLALAAANEAVGEQTKELEAKLSIQTECNILTSEENVRFKEKIEQLESEKSKSSNDNKDTKEQLEQLQLELQDEKSATSKYQQEIKSLQEKSETLEFEQEEMMTKYLEMEDKCSDFEEQIEKLKIERSDKESSYSETEGKAAIAAAALEAAQASTLDQENLNKKLLEEIKALKQSNQDESQKHETKAAEMNSALEAVNTKTAEQEKTNKKLLEDVKILEQSNQDDSQKYETKVQEKEQIISALEEKFKNLQEDFKNLEKSCEELGGEKQELLSKLESKDSELSLWLGLFWSAVTPLEVFHYYVKFIRTVKILNFLICKKPSQPLSFML